MHTRSVKFLWQRKTLCDKRYAQTLRAGYNTGVSEYANAPLFLRYSLLKSRHAKPHDTSCRARDGMGETLGILTQQALSQLITKHHAAAVGTELEPMLQAGTNSKRRSTVSTLTVVDEHVGTAPSPLVGSYCCFLDIIRA